MSTLILYIKFIDVIHNKFTENKSLDKFIRVYSLNLLILI